MANVQIYILGTSVLLQKKMYNTIFNANIGYIKEFLFRSNIVMCISLDILKKCALCIFSVT